MSNLLEAKNLSKFYKEGNEEIKAVNNINFSINSLAAFVSACLWDLPNADDFFSPSIKISQENLFGSPFNLETSVIL